MPRSKTQLRNSSKKSRSPHKIPALHAAILEGNSTLVKKLIEEGANLDELYQEQTPLHYALTHDEEDCALQIISSIKNLEATYRGKTPLYRAVENNMEEIVKNLLQFQADPNTSYEGCSALHLSIKNKNSEIYCLLNLANADNTTCYNNMSVFEHIISVRDDILATAMIGTRLIRQSLNAERTIELFTFCLKNNHNAGIAALLNNGLDLTIELNNKPLIAHLFERNINVLLALMTYYKRDNHRRCKNYSLLHNAIKNKFDLIIMTVLLENGEDPNEQVENQTPIATAIKAGNLDALSLLLNLVDLNQPCLNDLTPLQLALDEEQFEMAKLLIFARAKIDKVKLKIFGIPLTEIPNVTYAHGLTGLIKYISGINAAKCWKEIVRTSDLSDTQLEAGLQLLKQDIAKKKLHLRLSDKESAIDDKLLNRADDHYQTIKANFAKKFEERGGLLNIEAQIRDTFLKQIKEHAQNQKLSEIVEFIEANHRALVNGEDEVLKASLNVFNLEIASHTAWRCYNPYAPVPQGPNGRMNLLALADRPINVLPAEPIISTNSSRFRPQIIMGESDSDYDFEFDSEEELFNEINTETAILRLSLNARTRAAYYYLVATDSEIPKNLREDSIALFTTIIANIRNSNGKEISACFPGMKFPLTQTASFHPRFVVPQTPKEAIQKYLEVKALALFKKELQKRSSIAEKENYFVAITGLNHLTAADILQGKENYTQAQLKLKSEFFSDFSYDKCKKDKQFPKEAKFVEKSKFDKYLENHQEEIIAKIQQVYLQAADSVPSAKDIAELNPFNNQKDHTLHDTYKKIVEFLFEQNMVYRKSYRSLAGLAEMLKIKLPKLRDGADEQQWLDNFVLSLSDSEDYWKI